MPAEIARLLRSRDVLRSLDPLAPPAAVLTAGSLPAGARRVGILPGSFNPPTDAHWWLAEAALASGEVAAAAFLLSVRTVDKEQETGLRLADRLLVLGDLVAGRPDLAVIATNGGLYVDQAVALQSLLPPPAEIVFLVGFDKIRQIFDPRYYDDRDAALDRLFDLARILVAPRAGQNERDLAALLDRPENRAFADRVAPLPLPAGVIDADLSATGVRAALAAGEPPDGIPAAVSRFLAETGAFAPHQVLPDGERIDRYALRHQIADRLSPAVGRPDVEAVYRELLADALLPTPAGRAWRQDLARSSPSRVCGQTPDWP